MSHPRIFVTVKVPRVIGTMDPGVRLTWTAWRKCPEAPSRIGLRTIKEEASELLKKGWSLAP